MNVEIKRAITEGQLVLFFGAGASRSSTTKNGKNVLDGESLAQFLADKACLPYEGESLDQVYSAARSKMAERLDPVLEECFRFCSPSSEYKKIAQYPWRRIYTLNIDDALDVALIREKTQNISIRLGREPIQNRDQFFDRLDLIKLNGSANQLHRGEGVRNFV